MEESRAEKLKKLIIQTKCEDSHLFFTRYFFLQRQSTKFKLNWHHYFLSDTVERVLNGKTKNIVVINVPPGSSKTEMISINLMARGLAKNPWSRFLHLSYSDDLALTNSQTAKEIVESEEFQELWPMTISMDTKAKKRWNVMVNEKRAGGVYAAALGGQITGFRAGRMVEGFQGAIIIDDPLKPEDAYSKTKVRQANRRLISTVKSRKANPETPIVLIMQRLSEEDCTGFIKKGGLGTDVEFITIPAILTDKYVSKLPKRYQKFVDNSVRDEHGRFSYWQYKEPIKDLCEMEKGSHTDKEGSLISRYTFAGQYMQNPTAIGGNLIHGEHLKRYKILPPIKHRRIYADTAQKTEERNDFSVFELWGEGADTPNIYLMDLIRGKWEAPELKRRAVAFWNKHSADQISFGQLRKMYVEDKSSGTGLIQEIAADGNIPIEAIQRSKDRYTRALDAIPYIEVGQVWIPEAAPFTNGFVLECEAFTPDDTHAHDDQLDPMFDAIEGMVSQKNKIKVWEKLGKNK